MKVRTGNKIISIIMVLAMVIGIIASSSIPVNAQSEVWVPKLTLDASVEDFAFDSSGNMFVLTANNKVNLLLNNGQLSTIYTSTETSTDLRNIALKDDNHVFISDGDGHSIIELSCSEGRWTSTKIKEGCDNPCAIAVDKSGNIYYSDYRYEAGYGANKGAISKSTTSGGALTWDYVVSGAAIVDIAIDSKDTIFAANDTANSTISGNVMKYDTNTSSWVDIGFSLASGYPRSICFDNEDNLYVIVTDGDFIKGTKQADGSYSWADYTVDLGDITYPSCVAVSPTGQVYISYGNQIYTVATQYQVTFDVNSNSAQFFEDSTVNVISGERITLPSNPPTDYHKTFCGWYTSPAGMEYTNTTAVTSDITLYAKWTDEPKYSIAIDPNITGGSISVSAISAYSGDYISISTKANEGKQIDPSSCEYSNGLQQTHFQSYFEMPNSNVTVSAIFVDCKDWVTLPDASSSDYCIVDIAQDASGNSYVLLESVYDFEMYDGVALYDDSEEAASIPNNKIFKLASGGENWEEIPQVSGSSIGVLTSNSNGELFAVNDKGDTVYKLKDGSWTTEAAIRIDSTSEASIKIGGEFTELAANNVGRLYGIYYPLNKSPQLYEYVAGTWTKITPTTTIESDDKSTNADDVKKQKEILTYADGAKKQKEIITYPRKVAADDSGNLYCLFSIKDYYSLMKYTNGVWTNISLPSVKGYIDIGGMCTDNQGNLYITNSKDGNIYVYSNNGTWSKVISDGLFSNLRYISIDKSGKILIYDGDTYELRLSKRKLFGSDISTTPTTPTTPTTSTSSTQTVTSSAVYTAPAVSTTSSSAVSTITANAEATSSGAVNASVSALQVSSAVDLAIDKAAKLGNNASAHVEIKVDAPKETKSIETIIPKASVDNIAKSNTNSLDLNTPIACITFDRNAIDTISGASAGDVKVAVARVDLGTLSQQSRDAIGDRPVYNFSVTSGDKTISQFGGEVTVEVAYTLKTGEDPNSIVIYYINAQGNLEPVSNCYYDAASGKVRFTTNHFSKYAVGYNPITFKDVSANSWYSKSVAFVAARGILVNSQVNTFGPGVKMTRGEFITILLKAYGIEPEGASAANFSDAGDTYYTGYLAAAKKLGITSGVGNNKFAPEKEISRQEIITLIYNMLKLNGKLPQTQNSKAIDSFSDAKSIAPWAKEAMSAMIKAGIISGNGNKLNPNAVAVRVEMAQILYKLLAK